MTISHSTAHLLGRGGDCTYTRVLSRWCAVQFSKLCFHSWGHIRTCIYTEHHGRCCVHAVQLSFGRWRSLDVRQQQCAHKMECLPHRQPALSSGGAVAIAVAFCSAQLCKIFALLSSRPPQQIWPDCYRNPCICNRWPSSFFSFARVPPTHRGTAPLLGSRGRKTLSASFDCREYLLCSSARGRPPTIAFIDVFSADQFLMFIDSINVSVTGLQLLRSSTPVPHCYPTGSSSSLTLFT